MAPVTGVFFARRLQQADAPKADDFTVKNFDDNQELQDGEVLVRTLYLSVDPYMKFKMIEGVAPPQVQHDEEIDYLRPWKVGDLCSGAGLGVVLKSRFAGLSEHDLIESAFCPWKTIFKIEGKQLNKIENDIIKSNLPKCLGLFGVTGLTAWVGLKHCGHIEPGKGQTVVVSGAAGATGSAAGQIARIMGATNIVGICGSDAKCKYITEELGFSSAINYKTDDVAAALKKACPAGVDTYFDNVGGEISNNVIRIMNQGSHVALCGQISTYGKKESGPPEDVKSILQSRNITSQFFVVLNHKAEWPEGLNLLAEWYKGGKLKSCETITEGIENIGHALVSVMTGGNIGKQVVKVA